MKSRITARKVWLTLTGIGLVLGLILGIKAAQIGSLISFGRKAMAAGMPPTAVASARAEAAVWENTLRFTGSLRAIQGVMLTAELPGKVIAINAENGAEIQKDEILIELDTRQEQADLASAQAALKLAKINRDRTQGLLEKRILAQSEFDTAQASFDQAAARVGTLEATIAKKIIRAPFSGRLGLREVNLGQIVATGDNLIPLHSSDPIYIEFSVPQTQLDALHVGQKLRVTADGAAEPIEGEITAVNPVVDEATRTARAQGTLRNPGHVLRAGLFAEVEVILPQSLDVVQIPLSAVLTSAYGDSVFVVEEQPEGKTIARQQFVKLGPARGDFVSVIKGITAGERVVSAGAFKLSNGAAIRLNDAMQPVPSLTPTPDNS